MITVKELEELKAMHKRMGEIMARIEATPQTCHTCGHFTGGYCAHWNADVPPEAYRKGCEAWEFSDIPF